MCEENIINVCINIIINIINEESNDINVKVMMMIM